MKSTEVLEHIKKGSVFLVAGHVEPDGDTITSTLLMGRLLKHLGKKYILYMRDPVPEKFLFLPWIDEIKTSQGSLNPDTVITLDAPNLERVGLGNLDAKIINIDHHLSNESFGDVNWLERERSAACLMVFELLRLAKVPVDRNLGSVVFTGLYTETGGFSYPNVSPEVFRVCSEVVAMGVKASDIALRIDALDARNISLLSAVLGSLKMNDGIATIELTEKMLSDAELAHDEHDSDSFIRYAVSIPGIKVAIYFREIRKSNLVRMSFRSLTDVDVNKLAARFGGGGHPMAAGARLEGDYEDVKRRVIEETKRYIACAEG